MKRISSRNDYNYRLGETFLQTVPDLSMSIDIAVFPSHRSPGQKWLGFLLLQQPINPRRQRFYIKRINHRLTIDQVITPVAFIFALEDRSGLVSPKVDFYSYVIPVRIRDRPTPGRGQLALPTQGTQPCYRCRPRYCFNRHWRHWKPSRATRLLWQRKEPLIAYAGDGL